MRFDTAVEVLLPGERGSRLYFQRVRRGFDAGLVLFGRRFMAALSLN